MASAKMTLIGLHDYLDGRLWDKLQLPAYFDKDVLINTILLKCGEFEVMYPNPGFMMTFIGIWADKNQRFFEHLAAAMQEEYKPLANYDRYEEFEDHATGSGTTSGDYTDTDHTLNVGSDTGTTGDTTENQVSAFNATNYQPRDKQTGTGSHTNQTREDITRDSSGSRGARSSDRTDSNHKGHMWGNIGVTTTQAILLEEIRVSAISPYDLIADMFSNEFSVKVYI